MPMNILITGASRGIGRATACLAGTQGWTVGVNYLQNESSARCTVDTVKANGGNALALQADTSVEADVLRLFDAMEHAHPPLTGVVINAGITAPALPLAQMDAVRLKRMFDTNIFGAYLVAREAARRLSSGGSIVILSSKASVLGSPNEYVDYAGTKGAMDSLTVGLAKELGPKGIRVNAVRPGAITTEIHAQTGDPDRVWRIGEAVPFRRPGSAQEVAEAVVWLLDGAKSSYVTGALLDVTGGR